MSGPVPRNADLHPGDSTEPRQHSESPLQVSSEPVKPSTIGRQVESRRDDHLPNITTQPRLRLLSEDPLQRAAVVTELGMTGGHDSFELINQAFDDPSPAVRIAAAHALYQLRSDRASSFINAFRDASPDRRRRMGGALAESGLAGDAIANLSSEDRDTAYDSYSMLFLIAQAGEIESLLRAVEEHQSIVVRQTLIQLLALTKHPGLLPAFNRLAVRQSLPSEVRSSLTQAIREIRSGSTSARAPEV